MNQIQPLDRCWALPKKPPVIVQLGRYGDLILLLPAFKLIYDRTGKKPIIIVSDEYASVLDGASYVTPHPIRAHWYMGMPKARQVAESMGGGIVPQWWNDSKPADVPKGPLILQCHGDAWGVDIKKYPDFGTSMWVRAGFSRKEMIETPLVFDRRSPEREESLVKRHVRPNQKLLLYNFTGVSSPFAYGPEMLRLLSDYRNKFQLLDLGAIRATRIYDLLGLYEKAAGIITTDTATLHLCPAVKIPSIMFTVPGWTSSVARGNVALNFPYDQFPRRASEIRPVLDKWASQ